MELTINVNIAAPELCGVLNHLADMLGRTLAITQPQTPVTPTPPPPAPQPIPATPAVPVQQTPATPPTPTVAPQPVPAAPAVPVQQTPVPTTAPVQAAASQQPVPVFAPAASTSPAVPVAGVPTYTLEDISRTGAALVDAGRMNDLMALLNRYGLQAITQLQPEQYGAFATELRQLGGRI